MTTLQDAWREYRDACYPTDIPATQNRECHQAFFAGALIALDLSVEMAALPEDAAVQAFDKLITEAQEMARQRIQEMKASD